MIKIVKQIEATEEIQKPYKAFNLDALQTQPP